MQTECITITLIVNWYVPDAKPEENYCRATKEIHMARELWNMMSARDSEKGEGVQPPSIVRALVMGSDEAFSISLGEMGICAHLQLQEKPFGGRGNRKLWAQRLSAEGWSV